MPEIQSWTVFIGVATVDFILLIKLLTSKPSTELLLAILFVTTLLCFSFRIKDVTKAKVGKEGVELEAIVEQLGTEIKMTDHKLEKVSSTLKASKEDIDNLFLLSMGPSLYQNLEKIASRKFGEFKKQPGGGLERELYYLRTIGYVEVKDNSIRSIPEAGPDLSRFVTPTKTGEDFVKLRKAVELRHSLVENSSPASSQNRD